MFKWISVPSIFHQAWLQFLGCLPFLAWLLAALFIGCKGLCNYPLIELWIWGYGTDGSKGAKEGSKVYTNRNAWLIVKEIRGWTGKACGVEVTCHMESESPPVYLPKCKKGSNCTTKRISSGRWQMGLPGKFSTLAVGTWRRWGAIKHERKESLKLQRQERHRYSIEHHNHREAG